MQKKESKLTIISKKKIFSLKLFSAYFNNLNNFFVLKTKLFLVSRKNKPQKSYAMNVTSKEEETSRKRLRLANWETTFGFLSELHLQEM